MAADSRLPARMVLQTSAMQAAMSVMAFLMPGYPWHASGGGDLDLTGHRKPQSHYHNILWDGGDRFYATVRLPEPEGKMIIAAVWAAWRGEGLAARPEL